MELADKEDKYLVVGYKPLYHNSTPTVVIYGMYDSLDVAKTRQTNISGKISKRNKKDSVVYGDGIITWIKKIQTGDMKGCDIKSGFER